MLFRNSTKGTWRTVLEKFPDSLHVIAVDLPGHGGTTFRPSDGFTAEDMAKKIHQLTETLGDYGFRMLRKFLSNFPI